MNQAVTIQGPVSRIDSFCAEVLPPDRAADLFRSLAAHIRPEVFERNLLNALMANPDLMNFDPRLVYREVSKAAGLGLLLDPQLGEAYMVVAYNYKTGKKEPQLRVGYKGMCKLARQTGDVSTVYSHEVCENDVVECDLGFPKVIHIKPKSLFVDRGKVQGYVAVIAFKDGTFDFEPMSVEQAQGIRNRSDAWKAFTEKKIKSTPWSTDEGEMSKKTVLRRLLKRQAQSPELADAIRIEDEAEFPNMREARPPAPKPPAPEDQAALAPPAKTEPPRDPAKAVSVRRPPPPDLELTANPAPADLPKMPDPAEKPVEFVDWLDVMLGQVASGEDIQEIYASRYADLVEQLPPTFSEDAMAVLCKHERRIEP